MPHIDLPYSVDFAVPVGTPVTARDGIVKSIFRSKDCYQGLDAKIGRINWSTNIDISHPDLETPTGTVYSMLQHLDPDTIQVVHGQEVTKGQVLALTGLSGWVGPIPHLHLSIADSGTHRPIQTLPFDIRNYSWPLDDDSVEMLLAIYGSNLSNIIIDEREKARRVMLTVR